MPAPVEFAAACPCGATLGITIYTLVNAETDPHLVTQMENGVFHHGVCTRCGKHVQVDKWFLYQDPANNVLVHVFPREYRHAYLNLQHQLVPLHRLCGIEEEGPVQIVFGIDGLLAFLRGERTIPPVLFPDATPRFDTRH